MGAVDSFIDAATLGQLDAEGRVLAEHISDGFALAKGSGFCYSAAQKVPKHSPRAVPAGLALENGHRYSEQPMLGQGLDRAVKQAILHAPPHHYRPVFHSQWRILFNKELGTMLIRNSSHLAVDVAHHHPADALGDMGAATAAALLAMAMHGIIKTTEAIN